MKPLIFFPIGTSADPSNVMDVMEHTLSQLKQENTSVVLDFESLSVINQYCSKMYRLVPENDSGSSEAEDINDSKPTLRN